LKKSRKENGEKKKEIKTGVKRREKGVTVVPGDSLTG
jgi:hypothetical protein